MTKTLTGLRYSYSYAILQTAREARIEFNTLRKIFFLSRKKLKAADPSDPKLRNKLQLLRWSIKVLGTEELKSLPPEVISLM